VRPVQDIAAPYKTAGLPSEPDRVSAGPRSHQETSGPSRALVLVVMLSVLAWATPAGAAVPFEPPPLPPEPAPPVERPEDCPPVDLYPGEPVPPEASGCRGVVVSVGESDAAEEWIADAIAVRGLYAVVVPRLTAERDAARWELDQIRPRWWERPGLVLGLGVVLGTGVTLGSGYVAVQAWAP